MDKRSAYDLAIRYGLLVILGIFLSIYFLVFTPLTVYPVYWALSFIDGNTRLLVGNTLFFKGMYAAIVPACVAGSAYYLLTILNLSTPMKIETRVKSLGFLFGVFLSLNIVRILFFANLLQAHPWLFEATHLFTWYIGSTVMVVALWFLNVKAFKISSIPVYTDIKKMLVDVNKNKANGKRMNEKR